MTRPVFSTPSARTGLLPTAPARWMIGRAEVSADNGKSWRVVTEFTARRK